MRVLVTGGAGYIGSHTVRMLVRRGHDVTVLDDLSTGHLHAVPGVPAIHADLTRDRLEPLLAEAAAEVTIHFAGKALVPESVSDPGAYYQTNVVGGIRLLDAMRRLGQSRIVFSSTCATYGVPDSDTIHEGLPTRPITPYGRSKLVFETVLADYAAAYGFSAIALRYFNAAGAEADGQHGEDHAVETHLIPLLLAAARDGGTFKIMGTDYPTPDGSCVRDYIHVDDLAEAHLLAVKALRPGHFEAINLGTGVGTSVREVVALAQEITGGDFKVVETERRLGDPPRLVAAVDRAVERLGFRARRSIRDILQSAWGWHRTRPDGYGASPTKLAPPRFGDLAIELGFLTEAQLATALAEQRGRVERGESHKMLGLLLLQSGVIDTTQLIGILRAYQDRTEAV